MEPAYYDIEIKLNVDGNEYPCDIGFEIVDKGTIFVDVVQDWITDPPEMPAISTSYVENVDVEDIPSFKVVFLYVKSPTRVFTDSVEEVDAYFVMNPGTKDQVMKAVENYCTTDLVREVEDNDFESTGAYDVHITE